jgi:hypothetical protein
MSIRIPSPMQAPAARSLPGKTVMSWQPLVVELPLPPGLPPLSSAKRSGTATTAAWVGFFSGTLMIEIESCGGGQPA